MPSSGKFVYMILEPFWYQYHGLEIFLKIPGDLKWAGIIPTRILDKMKGSWYSYILKLWNNFKNEKLLIADLEVPEILIMLMIVVIIIQGYEPVHSHKVALEKEPYRDQPIWRYQKSSGKIPKYLSFIRRAQTSSTQNFKKIEYH